MSLLHMFNTKKNDTKPNLKTAIKYFLKQGDELNINVLFFQF